MTTLLKQWENSDLLETRQVIHYSKGNYESFLKKINFLLKLSHGQLNEILACFSRFLLDLSLIILRSGDHGYKF